MPTTEAPPRPPPPSQLGSFDPSINFHSRTLFSLASTIHALFDLSPSVQVKKFISYQTRLISELSNRVADHKRILNRFSRTHSTSSLRTIRDSSSLLYNHSSYIYNPSYTFYDQMNGREIPPPSALSKHKFSLREIYDSLLALHKAFPNRIAFDPQKIIWLSDDAIIRGANFGKFKVTLKLTDMQLTGNPPILHASPHIQIVKHSGNTASFGGDHSVFHPHAQSGDGSFCLGDAAYLFNDALNNLNLVEAFDILQGLLNNKTRGDGFGPLITWFLKGGRVPRSSIHDPGEWSPTHPESTPIRPMQGYTLNYSHLSQAMTAWLYNPSYNGLNNTFAHNRQIKSTPRPTNIVDPPTRGHSHFLFLIPFALAAPRNAFYVRLKRNVQCRRRNNVYAPFQNFPLFGVAPFPQSYAGLAASLGLFSTPPPPRVILTHRSPTAPPPTAAHTGHTTVIMDDVEPDYEPDDNLDEDLDDEPIAEEPIEEDEDLNEDE